MKSLIIMIILLLSYTDIKNLNDKDKFFEINYENILQNKLLVPLSQIASNVQYIKLETNPSCNLYARGTKFFFVDSLIFVQNVSHVLKFSINGKFLKKIGTPGRGPGEISLISSMSIIPNKSLLAIHDSNKLLYFSFDGDLVKTVKIPLYNGVSYYDEVKALDDSKYIAYNAGTNGFEQHNFILVGNSGQIISTVKNYSTWESVSKSEARLLDAFEPFHLNGNSYFFRSKYNDTVYSVNNAKNKIEPNYLINFGRYKLPLTLIPEKIGTDPSKLQEYRKWSVYYYRGASIETSNQIFIRSSCYGKRDIKYLIYDKTSKEGGLLVNESGESTGFINDWDCGLDFWPIGQKDFNQIIMPIDIIDLRKKLEISSTDKRSIKYPDKHKALQTLMSKSDDLDNPIIMVVTLKK